MKKKSPAKKSSAPKSRVAKKTPGKPRRVSAKPAGPRPTRRPAFARPAVIARRWMEEIWNARRREVLAELMHPEATGVTEGGTVTGHADFYAKLHDPLLAAFPDLRLAIDGIIAEGDEVAVRWTITATHQGEFAGLPASNRRVSFTGVTWFRCQKGQVVAGWDHFNAGALLAALKDGTPAHTVTLV
jgi:steroid delta-isomerase-like uncharacterized protein